LAGIIPAKAVVNKYFFIFFYGRAEREISFEFLVLGFEVLGPERAQIRVVFREEVKRISHVTSTQVIRP
jgi:hypothetical protein